MSILCAAVALAFTPQAGGGAGVLAKHVEALKAAKSLTVSFSVENLPAAPESYKLSYAKPDKVRIETPGGMIMTDGKTVWEYTKKTNEYTERPGDMKELVKQLQSSEYAAWAAFFIPDQLKGVKDAAITGKRSMKGNPVTQVDFTLDASRSLTASFYVDDKLGFARGASFKASRSGDKTETVVKATEIVVGDSMDEGLFAFSAPAGSKKVEISVSDMAKWYDDLDEGLKVAKATNRMVFIDFGAVWWHWCKEYARVVFPTDEFKAQSKYFVFVHIDVDAQKAVKQRFGVGGIPDLRWLKNDGTEVHKVVGYKGMAVLQDFEKARELGK